MKNCGFCGGEYNHSGIPTENGKQLVCSPQCKHENDHPFEWPKVDLSPSEYERFAVEQEKLYERMHDAREE